MKSLKTLLILSCSLFLKIGQGQELQFTQEFEMSVLQNGSQVSMPLAGGLNNIQLNTIDVNGDGKDEIVVWERTTNSVKIFERTNADRFRLLKNGEKQFPQTLRSWLLLRDFNGDGRKDLFTGDPFGIRVWVNTTTTGSTMLTWRPFHPGFLLLTEGFSGTIPIKVNENDIPAIVDVDGDGDLDILNTRFVGNSTIEYHQNLSIERTGKKDSLQMKKVTEQWGQLQECGCGEFSIAKPCLIVNGRTTHTGGKALNTIDIDNDGDQDLLFGEENCDQLFLLRNKGNASQEFFDSWENFPQTTSAVIPVFPTSFIEDVDGDTHDELIVSVNGAVRLSPESDPANSIWKYRKGAIDFELVQKNFLQDQMIDVGDESRPAVFDIDADGDYDLIISSAYPVPGKSGIFLFENTGTPTSPVLTLKTKDWFDLSKRGLYNLRPSFADINADRKTDLIVTATSSINGLTEIYYLANEKYSGFESTAELKKIPDVILERNQVIRLRDINGDLFPDILTFNSVGELEYLKNTGSNSFVSEIKGFAGLSAESSRSFAALDIADVNGDYQEDLLIGHRNGRLSIVTNFRNGQLAFKNYLLGDTGEEITTEFQSGRSAHPVVVNLFGSPYPSILIGTMTGGLFLLKNQFNETPTGKPRFTAFPNPVNNGDIVRVYGDREATVQVYSAEGKKIVDGKPLMAGVETPLSLPDLTPGVYMIIFRTGGKKYSFRLIRN